MTQNTGFAKRLRDTRLARSMSSSDLARLTKVTPAAVWNWETNGTIPRAGALATLAKVLNINSDWLLTGQSTVEDVSAKSLDLSTFPLEEVDGRD